MFVSVQFGYNQSKLLNINCKVSPLLDAISDGCYKNMLKYMKTREEFFNKEIGNLKKNEKEEEEAIAAAKKAEEEKKNKGKAPPAKGKKQEEEKKEEVPETEE